MWQRALTVGGSGSGGEIVLIKHYGISSSSSMSLSITDNCKCVVTSDRTDYHELKLNGGSNIPFSHSEGGTYGYTDSFDVHSGDTLTCTGATSGTFSVWVILYK